MLTACKDEIPNPHKNCIREILDALICYDNDLRCIDISLRNLQNEYAKELEQLEFRCVELRKPICRDSKSVQQFTDHILTIDEIKNCFASKINDLTKNRNEILEGAKQCVFVLNAEKCKLKQFHERTVDHLKLHAIKSQDQAVVRNCEKDICEMQKLFVKEVTFIKKCEMQLHSLFRQLQAHDYAKFCNCCCFKEYPWIPKETTFDVVDGIGNNLKNIMGTTLRKAFAEIHIRQPSDPKSFLAAYLMNIEENEKILKEKLNIFGNLH